MGWHIGWGGRKADPPIEFLTGIVVYRECPKEKELKKTAKGRFWVLT